MSKVKTFVGSPKRSTHLVPLHDELVRPGDELDIVIVVELLDDVAPEQEPGAAGGHAPAGDLCGELASRSTTQNRKRLDVGGFPSSRGRSMGESVRTVWI
jgi:hypothetical protein